MSTTAQQARPVRVVRPGSLVSIGDRIVVQGWQFDLGGRPQRADWQQAYQHELYFAIATYIAARADMAFALQPEALPEPQRVAVEFVAHAAIRKAAGSRPRASWLDRLRSRLWWRT
jgi:hypothetical protein